MKDDRDEHDPYREYPDGSKDDQWDPTGYYRRKHEQRWRDLDGVTKVAFWLFGLWFAATIALTLWTWFG